MNVCVLTHGRYEGRPIRNFIRCRSLAADWPALLGSLSFRRSPACARIVRPVCRGEQHRSYVLYGRQKGRRVAVYVPEELVPEVQRGLDMARLRLGMVRAATLRRNVLNLL